MLMIDRRWRSRELGLELASDLLDIQDLHYGLWDGHLELCLANLPAAQQRYTEMILEALPAPDLDGEKLRLLDIGCGTGHILSEFYDAVANSNFAIERDDDITEKVSPNYALLNDLLENRIGLAATTVNRYLMTQHAFSYRALLWLFRKKIERLRYKYFSGYRSQETFERYKSYRLVILRNEATRD